MSWMSDLDIRIRNHCRAYREGRCPLLSWVFDTEE